MSTTIAGTATHQGPLLMAALKCNGPVIECGAGYYSTPLLHEACKHTGKMLITMDNDPEWVERVKLLVRDDNQHIIQYVDNWLPVVSTTVLRIHPELLFIDCAVEVRSDLIKMCHDMGVHLCMAHDCEEKNEEIYKMKAPLALFKYRRDWVVEGIKTSLVSDSLDVSVW